MQLWFSSLFFFATLAFAQDFAPVANGFRVASSGAPESISISVISQEKAHSLFRSFAQNPDIPFKYLVEGCHARAHEMARMAESQKVIMGKIYVEGDLQAKTASWKKPLQQWGWHVSTTVYVVKPDGSKELMVFDPSLFDRPVSVEEWKNKFMDTSDDFRPQIRKVYYGSRYQYYRNYEDYKSGWEDKDVSDVKERFEKYRQLQESSPARDQSFENSFGGVK